MYSIRLYTELDYPEIKRWYKVSTGQLFPKELIPPTTFILELDSAPALSLSAFLTNSDEICYIEGLIGNPDLKGKKRAKGTKALADYCFSYLKDKGYKKVIFYTHIDKLKDKYVKEMGAIMTLSNLSSFVKEL